nr:arginase family protein [uncultured Desulfobulbus sp.]
MKPAKKKPLRLIFPQWQGGNNPLYHLGAQLLEWLAPQPTGPVEEIAVPLPDERQLPLEKGMVARQQLLQQLQMAGERIQKHQPDHLIVFGGDCLVELAPFGYFSQKHGSDLAILWIDPHPDIMTTQQFEHGHAMVLGMLMGHGDTDFVQTVSRPLSPDQILYVGLNEPNTCPGMRWHSKTCSQNFLFWLKKQRAPKNAQHNLLAWSVGGDA